jgi:hypothetical protein
MRNTLPHLAAWPTPRDRAINSAPVHRYPRGFLPKTPRLPDFTCEIPRHRFRCIAIHAPRIHQRDFGRFWRGKPWISSSSWEKRAEGVWGGAVNWCYGKFSRS